MIYKYDDNQIIHILKCKKTNELLLKKYFKKKTNKIPDHKYNLAHHSCFPFHLVKNILLKTVSLIN